MFQKANRYVTYLLIFLIHSLHIAKAFEFMTNYEPGK